MAIIFNAANRPINSPAGTVPDVSGALRDWYQPLTFTLVSKSVVGFQVLEVGERVDFRGIVQPFKARDLALKPEGQRAWTWLTIHTDPATTLNVDDVILFQGKPTRVMARTDYTLYGYVEYHVVQDYDCPAPERFLPEVDGGDAPVTGPEDVDGGSAFTDDGGCCGEEVIDGGSAFV